MSSSHTEAKSTLQFRVSNIYLDVALNSREYLHFHLLDLWCKQNEYSRFKFSLTGKIASDTGRQLASHHLKGSCYAFPEYSSCSFWSSAERFTPLFMTQTIKCQWEDSLERCVAVVTKSFSHPRKSLLSGVQNRL